MLDLSSARVSSFLTVLLSRAAGMASDPQGLGEGARSLQGALGGSCPCPYLDERLASHILSEPGGDTQHVSSEICAVLGLWLNVTELCSNATWKDFHPIGMANCCWNFKLLPAQPGWTWGTAGTASGGAKITLQPQNCCPGTASVAVWGGRDGCRTTAAGDSILFPQKYVWSFMLAYWNNPNSAALRFWDPVPCGLKPEAKKLLVVFLKIFYCVLGFICWGCCCYLFIYLNSLALQWLGYRLMTNLEVLGWFLPFHPLLGGVGIPAHISFCATLQHFSFSQLPVRWTKRFVLLF